MNDESGLLDEQQQPIRPVTNRRILVILAFLGVAGFIAGWAFESFRFGLGLLIGTALAFANYFWMKRSVKRIFSAAEGGERPRFLAAGYFVRYVLLGLAVAVIYFIDAVPFTALVLGLAGFAFAVMIEGFIRLFSTIFSEKEI